ncbi:MAG: glyceraldehyde 3-phosphate dehydrogenase NAD-binding domain-containing protein [bacterium]|nr:glyceraldehyde 3-phosphate dehydrogenase NAD-binding domain-containing protein [bacterium]
MNKPIKIAINGLGRVGRVFLRIAWGNPAFQIIAANSRSDLATYAHLIKYDSVYGTWDKRVESRGDNLIIDGQSIKFFQEKEAEQLPWKKVQPDLVVEATGKYKDIDDAQMHITSGAKYVVITAPIDGPGATLVRGINEQAFNPKKDKIISAASCTSICSALVVKVLQENFGIERGFINTVHAFTQDQNLHDGSHKDLRRARSASQSIIPTSTGVTKTIDRLFPMLKGKASGLAYRVPVPDPSVLSFTAQLKKQVTAEAVNQAFIKSSKNNLKGHLSVSDIPLVSTDFKQNPHGAIIDLLSTDVVDGKLANVVAWYDNEWGYVTQVVSLLEYLAKKI